MRYALHGNEGRFKISVIPFALSTTLYLSPNNLLIRAWSAGQKNSREGAQRLIEARFGYKKDFYYQGKSFAVEGSPGINK